MSEPQPSWHDVAERLRALAQKIKLHAKQSGDGGLPAAMTTLGQSVRESFDTAEKTIRDPAVRSDVRELGKLLADALTAAASQVEHGVRRMVRADRDERP